MDPDYSAGLAGASKELARTGYYFMLAFSLTFIFMYIVLAAQFESFHPPDHDSADTAAGGAVRHRIAADRQPDREHHFPVWGCCCCSASSRRTRFCRSTTPTACAPPAWTRYDAIMQANRDRLRPILMTTIALVAGMLPLVISNGTGAATNRSIGVLVVGGQTLCLLLTLLAVPVFYSLFEDLGDVFARIRSSKLLKLVGQTSLFLLLATCLLGQPAATLIEPLRTVELKPRVGIFGETKITLHEVIEKVLSNDPDLRISRIVREEAVLNVKGAKGYYDPVAGLQAYRLKSVTPVASLLGGTADGKLTQINDYAIPQLNGLSPWLGGSYSLSFSNSKQLTDSQFATLNPQYPTVVSLNLTQPLWRGLRFDENRYRLQVARKNVKLSTEQYRQRVIEITTQAIQAYWELDYARRNLDVQTEAVRLAEQQYASNRRQAEQGILAPIDVVAAQTQVATFQQNLFVAEQQLTQAENTLKTMMLPDRESPLWSTALIPETLLDPDFTPPSLADAVREALKSRPGAF